ncbi:MAG: TetR/AcrR family transcriptional regulator [Burkholderiaceae bacterium]|jgi:AcrR family transcriptional regulator|nr:TetR/AcrR family transcriptional regulator [Burkholderiaceae bacterium]MBX3614453.1 TetR/AcrR family transcriptional regulator [Burkholderiaceae bacterium]
MKNPSAVPAGSPAAARRRPAGAPRKGEQTRAAIVEAALELAARNGLEGLTIGALAERMQMSKSGVFAHFGSREDLQIAVLKAYERRFVDEVLVPGLKEKRGLPRLRAIFDRWLDRTAIEAARGCIWISGAAEYDDRPGAVREELVAMVRSWQRELSRAIQQAVDAGDLPGDLDVQELVFQLYGVILVLHHDGRLLDSPDAVGRARRSFDRLVDSYQRAMRTARPKKRTNVRSVKS